MVEAAGDILTFHKYFRRGSEEVQPSDKGVFQRPMKRHTGTDKV